jgi:hypothetical protein
MSCTLNKGDYLVRVLTVKLSFALPNTVTLKDLIKCKGSTSARL